MRLIILSTIGILLLHSVQSYSQSLTDCETVAALFSNTCTGTPSTAASWDDTFGYETVSCSQTSCPSGYGTAPTCAWKRKLCVTCYTSSSTTYMRVQTNGLPDHCFSAPESVTEQTLDISFKFNYDTSSMQETTFTDQDDFDVTSCKPAKSATVKPAIGLTNNLESDSSAMSLTTVAGVAINGVIILSSASAEYVDPFYPQAWSGSSETTAESVDACLGHPQGNGIYHYHILPPCIVNSANLETTSLCSAVSECNSDLKGYALDSYANYKTLKVLGVAKDGHLIYGPYQSDGTQFDCTTFDACGGTTLSDGSYAYIFQNVFPYSLNCFGPAEDITYTASCTTNYCNADSTSSSSFSKAGLYYNLAIGLLFWALIMIN